MSVEYAERRKEVPHPPVPPPDRPSVASQPIIRISEASAWVAGLKRAVRDFAAARACRDPIVRATLADGERLFVRTATAGPGDEFVTLAAHERSGGSRVLVVRLDAVTKVEILCAGANVEDASLTFQLPAGPVGFGPRGRR